jgi:DNA ligase-1
MAREFLMLAHVYDTKRNNPSAWYVSEKLDGMRCYYDGGITRGMLTSEVPWANTAKDGRYLSPQRATGLWSRYGKAIQAPDWFLDKLPTFPLDGELWMGRGQFQKVMSTVKDLVPGPAWQSVRYMIFDSPSYLQMFANGEIKLKKRFEKRFLDIVPWIEKRVRNEAWLYESRPFVSLLKALDTLDYLWDEHLQIHNQTLLPFSTNAARQQLEDTVNGVLQLGGEGVMLRNPTSLWSPSRVWSLLKYKPTKDSEGTVVGFTFGRETDLGSKLLGKMGALTVEWQGKRFKLSGFTDEERELTPSGEDYGISHPGEACENTMWLKHFKFGESVTFTYRELTDDGVPKEGRFLRKRQDE